MKNDVDGEGVGTDGRTFGFQKGPGRSLEVSDLLSVQNFQREAERHGLQKGLCWTPRT